MVTGVISPGGGGGGSGSCGMLASVTRVLVGAGNCNCGLCPAAPTRNFCKQFQARSWVPGTSRKSRPHTSKWVGWRKRIPAPAMADKPLIFKGYPTSPQGQGRDFAAPRHGREVVPAASAHGGHEGRGISVLKFYLCVQ